MKKIFLGFSALAATLVALPMFAAFEAHVVNVTATIENALFVHPQSLEYGTVFPQEHLESSFFIAFSDSFSVKSQTRVGKVDYVIKQKPEPQDSFLAQVGVEPARDYCENNAPTNGGDPNDPYYAKCHANLCPYLSKEPDNIPSTGVSANNDVGLPPFHDPLTQFAKGTLVKFANSNSTSSVGNDPSDTWTVDLAVPCFTGQCAQDWPAFVHGLNPAADPAQYTLPPTLEHQIFGCDLWVEVTKIYR